jgi:hypothetical protein
MKTKPEVSAEASTSAVGPTKPTQPLDGMIRLANWPKCLADKAVAMSIEGAAYEGYEQKHGRKTGLYRR